jgi:Ca-activated chloride channel homolog
MRFANAIFFSALVLVPLTIAAYFYRERRRGGILFSDVSPFRSIPPSKSLRLRHALPVLRALAIVALVIALARPQSTHKTEAFSTEGIDIVLSLDLSGSMKAEDFKPKNRFEAAKQVIKDFIGMNSSNRLGLVAYSAQAFTQCPLTLDYSVLLNILDQTKMGMIEDGTAIGMAIATSVNRMKNSIAKSKVIILLSDGRNNRGEIDPQTAAQIAHSFGIKIYTIGMGKEGGAPVPVDDPVFGRTYARNPDGSLDMEEPDEDTLIEIARITGGRYFRATDENKLKEIFKDIASMEKSKIKTEYKVRFTEYFQYFLLPGIALLILEALLAATRFRTTP